MVAGFDPARVLEQVLAHMTATVEIADPQGRLVHVNRRFSELTGYTREEAVGRTPAELLRSDLHDAAFYEAMWNTVNDKRVWNGELISRAKDGTLHHMLATVVPVLDDEGEIANLMAIKEPVSALGARENDETLTDAMARLRSSEQRYRTMVQAASDAILLADFDTALIVDANPAARTMFGYTVPEFRQFTGRMLTAPEDHGTIDGLSHALIHEGRAYAPRLRVLRKDGSRFWAALRMANFELGDQKFYVVTLRDVSDQVAREAELAESNEQLRAAQERLRRSERLAALGQLSAAVAHEINNPLQFVDLNLAQLQRELDGHDLPEDLDSMLEDLRDGVERIGNITRDLASFTRIERDKVEYVTLDEVVRAACRIVKNEIRHRARLELKLSSTRQVPADRGKLIQLVTNLLVNATHAIEEGHADENRITVRSHDEEEGLLMVVRDTGKGMTPDVIDRIFEPFFTTKPAGRGGGLGLPVCAEIVRLHQGTIKVASIPGRGTRFEIRLPYDNGLMAPSPLVIEPARPSTSRGRILIIDDDALVLRGVRRLLSSQHEVVTAEGGDEALRILGEDQGFDVVLCDLMMPVVDGPAIHDAVSGQTPELLERMIFCSGGAFTPRAKEFVGSVSNPLLKKPVRGDELLSAIDQVMNRSPRVASSA